MKGNFTGSILLALLALGCSPYLPIEAEEKAPTTFEECVAAGNPVTRSFPAQCHIRGGHTKDGQVFFQKTQKPIKELIQESDQESKGESKGSSCKDLCGDGVCQEMVCQALGCPCPENGNSCPNDCK